MTSPRGRVLIIAGSDSGGGAGIQADIKTVTCLGGYAATAITALTAQNTLGVQAIAEVDEEFIRQQIRCVLEDIGADAIKTGMLSKSSVIETVSDALSGNTIPLVLDPVMVAKGGAALLQPEAVDTLKTRLLPRAFVVTPNIPEAELLSGITIRDRSDMRKAGQLIRKFGAANVLVKGGHLDSGLRIANVLVTPEKEHIFEVQRMAGRHTHGTGCTLASAIATALAEGITLKDAVNAAQDFVSRAIVNASNLGHGHGPLGHNFKFKES